MIETVQDNLTAIRSLCRRYEVRRLELIGSAARGEDFDSARSDVDFLVEFGPGAELGSWLSRYFEFKEDLEALLECGVDLAMVGAPSLDSRFSHSVDEDRIPFCTQRPDGRELARFFGQAEPDLSDPRGHSRLRGVNPRDH